MPKVTNEGRGILQLPSGEFLSPGESADVTDEHLAWSGVKAWIADGDLSVEEPQKRGPGRPPKAVEAEADKE